MKIFNDKSIELNEYFEQLNKEKEVKKGDDEKLLRLHN